MEENDRLIAVSVVSQSYNDVKELDDVNPNMLDERKHFFLSYNEEEGIKFQPEGWANAKEARRIIKKSR